MKEKLYKSLRDNTVRKSNNLIFNSHFDLTLQQQKIMFFLTSQINYNDKDFKEYTFRIVDFCRICDIDTVGGKSYKLLKEAIKTLADKSIWITRDDGIETLLRFIEKPEIDKKRGVINVRIDKDMKPYLLQLRKNYTTFELLYTLRFKHKASPRLYELLKARHFDDLKPYVYVVPIDDLRVLLNADTPTYKQYKYFNKFVLAPALKEINEQTDLTITYKPRKTGKSITDAEFTIELKPPIERMVICDEIDRTFGNGQLTFAYLMQRNKLEQEIKEQAGGKK